MCDLHPHQKIKKVKKKYKAKKDSKKITVGERQQQNQEDGKQMVQQ